jgi:hypothetical protein
MMLIQGSARSTDAANMRKPRDIRSRRGVSIYNMKQRARHQSARAVWPVGWLRIVTSLGMPSQRLDRVSWQHHAPGYR